MRRRFEDGGPGRRFPLPAEMRTLSRRTRGPGDLLTQKPPGPETSRPRDLAVQKSPDPATFRPKVVTPGTVRAGGQASMRANSSGSITGMPSWAAFFALAVVVSAVTRAVVFAETLLLAEPPRASIRSLTVVRV